MAHPDMPDRHIVVDEVSVPHHQAAGWQVVPDQPQQPTPSAKRRRTTPRKDEA
ncbi:hypothetical protein ACF08A_25620 [Streptomyces cellulosae]